MRSLTLQNQQLFDTVGFDIDPVELPSQYASEEFARLASIISPSAEWNDQVKAMRELMAYVNGGALDLPAFFMDCQS
jgi:hypothetical protein